MKRLQLLWDSSTPRILCYYSKRSYEFTELCGPVIYLDATSASMEVFC